MRLLQPRFSVHSLLLATAVIGVFLAFYINIVQRQRRTVSWISEVGGTVMYDYQKARGDRANVFDPKAAEPGPSWLRQAVGNEFFQDVVMIDLAGKPITDRDLEQLKKLPKLENLNLSNTRVTSAGLVHLSGLKNLKWLSLWNTPVDDDGLRHLAKLTKLQSLILDGTRVTDSGLKHLEGLKDLDEWLGLSGTGVTDKGLVHLKGLSKLRQVNVRLTKVTADGAKELRKSLPKGWVSYGN
jgi:hypothetical protein